MRGHVCAVAALVAAVAGSPARAHDLRCTEEAAIAAGVQPFAGASFPRLLEDGLPWLRPATPGVLRIQKYPTVVGFDVTLWNVAPRDSIVRSFEDSLAALDAKRVVGVYGASPAPGTTLAPGEAARRVVLVSVDSYEDCLALGDVSPVEACVGPVESRFTVFHDSGSTECRARIVCEPQVDPWVGLTTVGEFEAFSDAADLHLGTDGIVYVTGGISGPWLPAGEDSDGFLVGWRATGTEEVAHRLGIAPDYYGLGRFALLGDGTVVAIASMRLAPPRLVKLRLSDGAEVWSVDVGDARDVAASALGAALYVAAVAPDGSVLTKLGSSGDVEWTRPAGIDVASAVAAHPGGGAYVGGFTGPARDPVVVRFDAEGNLLWTVVLAAGTDSFPIAGLAVGEGGDLYAALRTVVLDPVRTESWLVRLADDGTEVWRHVLEGRVGAIATGPGGVWAGGHTEMRDLWVRKLDGDGDLLWRTSFGTGFDMEWMSAMAVDAEGALYVAGGSEALLGAKPHAFVAKLGPEGVVR